MRDLLDDWCREVNDGYLGVVSDEEALVLAVMALTAQVKSVAEAMWLQEK